MKRIKCLTASVHSSLRSSVFLFDLTRVVEELMLNSLDAGATKVHISVSVGACYIKVDDNGYGITRDGLVILGEKYATSKLQNIGVMDGDFESLASRGEALSSLSDISLLEVVTKACGRPNAYRKVMKGRKCLFLGINEHRQDVGTTVIVRDLFYNQPVRRRSMQSSPKKVLHSIKKCVVRAALVHPQVSFNILDLESETELLRTLPSSSPLPLVSNNFGSAVSCCLHKISCSDKGLDLSGYLSGPSDTYSVKAFQYLYINSRFVSRSSVHKLINNLASSFSFSLNHWRTESEFHGRKRQRAQGCPLYMLNLHCPLSSYDLSFESSKTVVEFKDWAFVLSFIEQAVSHFWKQIPACSLFGESHKQKNGTSTEIIQEDIFSADAPVPSEMVNIGHGSHLDQHVLCHNSFMPSKVLRQEDYNVYCEQGSSRGLCGKTSKVRPYRTETEYDHQIDNFSEPFKLQATYNLSDDEPVYPRSRTDPWVPESSVSVRSHLLSDDTIKVDRKEECLLDSDDEKGLKNESGWHRSACHLYQNKSLLHNIPFLLPCSKGLDVPGMNCFSMQSVRPNLAAFSNHKDLRIEFDKRETFPPYGSYFLDAHDSVESSDSHTSVPCQEKSDHLLSPFNSLRSFPDAAAPSDISTDLPQFPDCHRMCYPKETNIGPGRVNNITNNAFSSQINISDEFPVSPKSLSDCFFMTDDDFPSNVRLEMNCNSCIGPTSGEFQNSKSMNWFLNNVEDISKRSLSTINCWDVELCSSLGGRMQDNYFSHKVLEKVSCAEINGETAWLNLNFPISDNTSKHSKHAINLHNQKCIDGAQWEAFQYCRFDYSANLRQRRSHSAPPFYTPKSKYSMISDYSKTIKTNQTGQYSDDDSTLSGITCTLKDRSQPCGTSETHVKSMFDNPAPQLLDRSFIAEKHSFEDDLSDMVHSDVNMTKWHSDDSHAMAVQGRARSHNFSGYEDDILDISSGILHLAGSLLVPESINRNSLKDVKVLPQVDRKFIPVIAGGILIAIDQHAADERIRLEELRQKVMSGEGHSVTYLDLEQELALPEIGLQLVQNYGEQIKKWGWICSSHVQSSGSFTKNLNLLNKRPCSINLLAVPCILGIKLTDKDLLEYLEQLADTDGTSTVPPSVLRVLNFKACRGAIMFGDPLLHSECSLIVEELKETSLCFQCAHGRPTIAPLVNMVELQKHLAKLESHVERQSKLWHGLQQHRPSVERAQVRLSSAKRFHNG